MNTDLWTRLLQPDTAGDESAMTRLFHALKRRLSPEKPMRVLVWDNGLEYSDWSISFFDIGDFTEAEVTRALHMSERIYRWEAPDTGFVVAIFEALPSQWKRHHPRPIADITGPTAFFKEWGLPDEESMRDYAEAFFPFFDYLIEMWSDYHFEMRTADVPTHYGSSETYEAGFLDLVMKGTRRQSLRHNFPVEDRARMEAEVTEEWEANIERAKAIFESYRASLRGQDE